MGDVGEAVHASGVRKSYPSRTGSIVALVDVDLSIKSQEFVSILGPSGCGKSTLLMIIAGLVPATAGTVHVGGRPVVKPITDVGIVFQRDLLFDWRTVLGNVMLQAEIRKLDRKKAQARALALLEQVGLGGFSDHRPWELSGGMRQRVALCRALLHEASLLLLDEPFGALDAMTRDEMNLDLQRLWWTERRTAVFITHSIPEAIFLSDRVIVMSPRPGRVVAEIPIELPRPRTLAIRDGDVFAEYQRQIRKVIETMDVLS